MDLNNGSTRFFPGPGTYNIPSFCDNIKNRYAKLKGITQFNYENPRRKNKRRRRKKRRRTGWKSSRARTNNNNDRPILLGNVSK